MKSNLMKIKLINLKLHKSNRANLVKVAKQVQGKTGTYQSHRWINPNKALDILKNDLLKQGIKEINNLTFEEKITDKAML